MILSYSSNDSFTSDIRYKVLHTLYAKKPSGTQSFVHSSNHAIGLRPSTDKAEKEKILTKITQVGMRTEKVAQKDEGSAQTGSTGYHDFLQL